jgi:hypothetical protein
MEHLAATQLVLILLMWALLSLGTSVVGLYRASSEAWRGFWLMSGMWGFIDGVIAWWALSNPPASNADLLPLLRINTALDVGYIAVGTYLIFRATPLVRGFGWAVAMQGLFLLALDGFFWRMCALE